MKFVVIGSNSNVIIIDRTGFLAFAQLLVFSRGLIIQRRHARRFIENSHARTMSAASNEDTLFSIE